ncbi:MAG: hypothetical protein ACJ8GJ_04415, partial [Vitreoscilla sp.]
VTWAWSPIKFQADMGILLTFMFVWNMLGALVLIPALSYFLLGRVGSSGRERRPTLATRPPMAHADSDMDSEPDTASLRPLKRAYR